MAPDHEHTAPQPTPLRFLVRSAILLAALAGVSAWLLAPLARGFAANPPLNGTILAVLAFGIVYTFVALVQALRAARAMRRADALLARAGQSRRAREDAAETLLYAMPRDLSAFLETTRRVVQEDRTAGTLPYLLDSLATRAEDRRALVRFLSGALILLGLIGTFYGLLITIGGVREVLSGISAAAEDDTLALLTSLRERMAVPLGGMALAFSSSLFGLSASLVLAFLELQLFHAQSDVHARVESLVVTRWVPLWRTGAEGVTGTAAPVGPQYGGAVLESGAEHLEAAAAALARSARREAEGTAQGAALTEAVGRLEQQIAALGRTLEQAEADRTAALRNELRVLTRTLAQGRAPGETQT